MAGVYVAALIAAGIVLSAGIVLCLAFVRPERRWLYALLLVLQLPMSWAAYHYLRAPLDGWLAGAVADRAGTLHGEVYRVTDPALWSRLDSVEGPQYHRREVAVQGEDGREMAAWIYWYIGPLDRGVPIPGGNYRAHAPGTSIYHQPSP